MNKIPFLFSMENTVKMASKLAKKLKINLFLPLKTVFADQEFILKSPVSVRGKDCFIVASLYPNGAEKIFELLLFIDSLRRGSAKSINLILNYYAYARQDRKNKGREPIGARLLADFFEKAGVTNLVTMDLHNPSIQGFFTIPVDDIHGQYVLIDEIKKIKKDLIVVSPDHGGAVRAKILAELLQKTDIAIIDKRRFDTNKTEVKGILGDVKNKNAAIIDDIIDTGGTILKAAEALKKNGAKKVIVCATHGIFSRGFEIFENSKYIDKVIVTNTIDQEKFQNFSKIKVLCVSDLLHKVIKAHIAGKSITESYEKMRKKLR